MPATTYRTTFSLSKPIGSEPVSPGTFGYFRARNRNRVYEVVISEFQNSGLTQAELAIRLGKGRDQVCRLLGSPGNWTLDTVSDVLFAISGGELDYSINHPLDRAPRNQRAPDWFGDTLSTPTRYSAGETVTSSSSVSAKVHISSPAPIDG